MKIFQYHSLRFESLTGRRVHVGGQEHLEALHYGQLVAVPLRGVLIWLKHENHLVNWAQDFSTALLDGLGWRTALNDTVVTVVDGGEIRGEFILPQGWMVRHVGNLLQLQAPLESEALSAEDVFFED